MKNILATRRLVIYVVAVCVLSILQTGCSDTFKWTEDVRLPDGRVITLERTAEFEGPGGGLGSVASESKQTLRFKNPDTGTPVLWVNRLEDRRLDTLALFMWKQHPMLLTTPMYGRDDLLLGCPSIPYFLHEYTQDRWIERPLTDMPLTSIRVNMTSAPWDLRHRQSPSWRGHLDVEYTSNSMVEVKGNRLVPHLLSFVELPEQAFNTRYCNGQLPRHDLVVRP